MENFYENLYKWQINNTLVSVTFTLPRKGHITFVGRILQINLESGSILFYNDDKKNVEAVNLNTLDDIRPFQL